MNKFLVSTTYFLMTAPLLALADSPPLPAGSVAAPTATGAAPVAAAPAGSGLMANLGFLVLMMGLLYFMMIRPQQKRVKEHQSMLGAMKTGDEVVTNSGILGKIAGMNDKVVTLEVAEKVQLKMLKSQIAQIRKGELKDLSP